MKRLQAEKDRLQAEKDRKHQEEMREMREMMALMRKNMGMDVDVASGGGGQAQLQKSRAAEKRREEQKGVEGQISDVQQELSEHGVQIAVMKEKLKLIETRQEKILDQTQPKKPKKRF
jgi:predicted peroxiredoxin